MRPKAPVLALGLLLAPLNLSEGAGVRAEEPAVVGRVRVSAIEREGAARIRAIAETIEAERGPGKGRALADMRVISVRPRQDESNRFDVTVYDYAVEGAFDLVVDGRGNELGRKVLSSQPGIALSELEDAEAILGTHSIWAQGVASGSHRLYAAMPPVTVDARGRRLVNVGVISRRQGSRQAHENEIVSVHVPSGEIVRHARRSPETSLATENVCGAAPFVCTVPDSSCAASYHVEWPAANPVWKFNVRHPSCTRSIQEDGTGLELTEVYYRDRLVLARAEMPVLNVLYRSGACGPYRDWLWSEDCFQATGTDVAPGIRVTTGGSAPATLCETESDSGNFRGVAIHDEGDSLWLMTETNAGWYRYVMEWRLHLDGTIEPIIGFGATVDSCVCLVHDHHAYWRFEFALDGTTADATTGIATLERRRAGTQDQWDPVMAEGRFYRPTDVQNDWWRIRNPQTGTTLILKPGAHDGDVGGDPYAKGDTWALAYNTGQIDDPNGNTSINIDPWVNGEAIGATKRLVMWYRAGFLHDVAGGEIEPCHLVGPRLERAAGPPPPVPDGLFGLAMTAERVDAVGSTIDLDWDTASCVAPDYHILYGPLASLAGYALGGGVCGLGTSGSYTWSGVPSDDLWFLVVGNDGDRVEGTWGKDHSGTHVGGTTASGQCGYSTRDNTGACP